jgi:tetratricopeptide (TPR) repeat protein
VTFADRLPRAEQAAVFEEFATIAYLVVHMGEAFAAIDQAIDIYEGLHDQAATGRCIRFRSRFHWYAGDVPAARVDARAAISILEPLGESAELARAYSGLSQLAMLASEQNAALEWGQRAVELATRLGDDRTKAHALVNIGTVRIQADPDDIAALQSAHELADASGERHEAVRALLNVGYTGIS